jgi:hypothetical protein
MRATRPRSPNENGPGASGSGGAVGGTMPLGECPCRIVEEHHPETREQDVERALGQLGSASVGHSELDRRIRWRKRARSADQRFGYVHAQHLAPRADAGGQS